MFHKSGMTARTPPSAQENPSSLQENSPTFHPPTTQESPNLQPANPQPNESHILDPNQQSCARCPGFDTLDMVQCDGCKIWLHFTCTTADDGEITEADFFCQQCTANMSATSRHKSDTRSRKSQRSSSSAARKKQLALERLEEERKLSEARDKHYLDQKYKTLEQFSNKGSQDSDSDDEKEALATGHEYTAQWVDNHRKDGNPAEISRTSLSVVPETNDLVDLTDLTVDGDEQCAQTKQPNVDGQDNRQSPIGHSSTVLLEDVTEDDNGQNVKVSPTGPTITNPNTKIGVKTGGQGAVRKPTNPLNFVDPNTGKQSNDRSAIATDQQIKSSTGLAGISTCKASDIPDNQPQGVNFNAAGHNRTVSAGLHPPASNVLNLQRSLAQNPPAPPVIRTIISNTQIPMSNGSTTKQVPGQSGSRSKTAANCETVSASHTPHLSSYVAGSGHLQFPSLTNQQIGNNPGTTPNNVLVKASSNNNVPPQLPLWDGGASNVKAFSQWCSGREQQNVDDGKPNMSAHQQQVDSHVNDPHSQSTKPNIIPSTTNPSGSPPPMNTVQQNDVNPHVSGNQQVGSHFNQFTSFGNLHNDPHTSVSLPPMPPMNMGQQNVNDGNSHVSVYQPNNSHYNQFTPFGHQYNDPYYNQFAASNTVPPPTYPFVSQQQMNTIQSPIGNISSALNALQLQNHPNPQIQDNTYAAGLGSARLTPNQIAARHVVGKGELPAFYGDIEKFPAFIRAYETTTEMCGYTDGENLNRLLKCLKGVALEFVEQQLCYPDDVPQVIETLKTLYNKPEFIIEKLMEKIAKQPSPQAEDLASIVKFSMSVQNICGTIRTAKLTDHLRNPSLMKDLVNKLPPSLQLQWACHRQSFTEVNLDTFGSWLYELAKLASSIAGPPKVKREKHPEKPKPKQGSSHNEFVNAQIESSTDPKSNSPSKQQKKCQICKQSSCQHIKDCKKFISLDTKERWLAVKEFDLCIRCFGKHRLKSCKSKQKCNIGNCQRAHNPLLHETQDKVVKNESKEIAAKSDNTANVNCSHQSVCRKLDIFRIVPIILYHLGRSVHTFAYLDDGSNVTTMEDELAKELELESSSNENLCVKWSFGKISKTELISRRVSVQISGVYANAKIYDLHNVRTVTDLALPQQTISSEWLTMYKHFEGIPITTYENAKPRMLIGLQYSKLMVSQKTIEGQWTEPIACKTRLGWVVQGPDGANRNVVENTYSANICECQPNDDVNLNLLVKNFFAWDDFGVRGTSGMIESKDVQRARKILESTTRKIDGHFETGLLWRFDDVQFPDSYPMALKRLECLERKMEKDPVLAQKMCDYIRDFLDKRYVRKLSTSELQHSTSRVWYLPIFPVFNPKKPEKFRVVWDAAAKVNKVSLNEMLLAGPDLLKPLPEVLRRFREKPIAIVGDMKEMFHQVRVISSDINAQRFLWRNGDLKAKPDVYVMDVLTFGGKNSPSSAQYAKNTNAMEYESEYPRAVEAIIDNHYQDDMLESFETIDETVRTTEEVKLIHRSGGFEIRNFMSNSSQVLERLGAKIENHRMSLDISNEPTIERVLGMFWNTSSDTFTYSLKFTKLNEEIVNGTRRPTKREVLSAIMSIFDPLGLIAQCLVYGKILLQKIWRDGTDWDKKISDLSYKHWCTWMEVLPEIEQIEIPRWYSPKLLSTNRKQIQLHIFVDASEEACAAAVYCRIVDDEGVDCCLMGAKTKVAPTKPLTVPRLELQAAVLGTRLVDNISKCQRIQASQRFFWSDSTTVMGWIQSEARKYHQYVAFRIGEILENSTTNEWNWVDTKNNVADDATKWNKKPNLSSTSRWYKAPSFLYQPQEIWPFGNDNSTHSTDEEMRAVYLLAHVEMPSNQIINATNFSNWHRLVRAMAYALRFVSNLKLRKRNRQIGPFSREEFKHARNTLIIQAQREDFLDEILIIRNNESLDVDKKKELHSSSVLRTCSPYLDEDGLLRVKGRIDASKSITINTKRPIILPRHNYITKLLILSYHQRFHHVNHQNTLNQIKQIFHIPALRVALKGVIQNLCQRCKNDKAKPVIPEMAELPPERLSTFTRPFNYVGVDYFGPLKVKIRRSVEKRWGVLFTCLTTRAVYIDIAHSLDTSSCIFCIRNFSNRHGPPSKYFSDNGLSFHGAEKELREEFRKLKKAKIEETFTDEHTQWSFNPPTAAHMGGVWERQIRTIKSVLKKMMPTRLPTDEMLKSFLIEIENIVNSTPLTYVQLDNVDDEVLTPNHFLKGSSNGIKSPGRFDPKNLCRDDWKAVQELTNQFWHQFVVEYIPTLTRRTKWFKSVKNLEVGDVVIDCDEGSDRNEWRKAIVEKVVVGKGNQVRRAQVRMIRGDKSKLSTVDITDVKHQSLWRPAAKLAVLDVKGNKLSSSPEPVNGEGNVVNAP